MQQKTEGRKIRVLILCGTQETSLHSVPPVADGAPEWNVFRLTEAAATSPHGSLDIHVISPCEAMQLQEIREFPASGQYKHVVFHPLYLQLYWKFLRHLLPLRLAVRRLSKLPDLLSWQYLRQVTPWLKKLAPDMVFINARPQYIRYLRSVVAPGKLWFFMRGEMGESRHYLGLLDGMIVNSRGMQEYVRQFIEPDKPPIWEMPNTLGDEFPVPIKLESSFLNSEKIILFSGRLIPDKGVMELLNAFKIVQKQLPDVRLIVCGASGNFDNRGVLTDYEKELNQKAAFNFPANVHFQGYVPNTQMGTFYAKANVAVFPSLCKESFGMVALEAMRCRTPVIASHQPGFEELIIPNETGLLVDDPRNAGDLADAILTLLRNPALAQRMGEAGYQRSLRYTPQAALQRFEEILGQAFQ